jgi:phospholipase C
VILMQENRSFDHALGMLRGVRGFNDPRALRLGNGNPVWLQTNAKGETYAPFRLNIHDTRATWMSYLPHAREPRWMHGMPVGTMGGLRRSARTKKSTRTCL